LAHPLKRRGSGALGARIVAEPPFAAEETAPERSMTNLVVTLPLRLGFERRPSS
jgi:hypothetical protein